MAGDATFSGTTYQGRVIALLYVYALAQRRLAWFGFINDTPLAVSGETGGPGDDAQIEFAGQIGVAEVQAKHGLSGTAELHKILQRIKVSSERGARVPVALVLDRGSSRWIWKDLPHDVERIRGGRTDGLRQPTKRLLEELEGLDVFLPDLYVIPADVDNQYDAEITVATQLLGTLVLKDPSQADAAWAVLAADADTLCAHRQRRTRADLVLLLETSGIGVRPPARDDIWHRQLDHTKQLIAKQHHKAALAQLGDLERKLEETESVDPFVWYRAAQQRAACLYTLGDNGSALLSARKALDYKPDGLEALQVASRAALGIGDLDAASDFADLAVKHHPHDGSAWGLRQLVASARNDPLVVPPPRISESIDYRKSILELAVMQNDRDRVLELTKDLLQNGDRSEQVLFHRANALIQTEHERARLQAYEEVERLTSEIVDSDRSINESLLVKALVLRSSAKGRLGKSEEAENDLAEARQLQADDADAIRLEAQLRLSRDDYEGALELLRYATSDEGAGVLLLRSRAEVGLGQTDEARRDLASAIEVARGNNEPPNVLIMAAELAIDLEDLELADELLRSVPESHRSGVLYTVMLGRLAFDRGEIEEARRAYTEAAQMDAHQPGEITAEFATRLIAAGKPREAVTVFKTIPKDQFPDATYRPYAVALLQASDLSGLHALVSEFLDADVVPTWTLEAATQLALRQEDPAAAIGHLSELVERPEATVEARIELTRLLLESRERNLAKLHIDHLVEIAPNLTPLRQMQVAQFMAADGRHDAAFRLAHSSYLQAPGDPRINRAFIMMAFSSKEGAPAAETVEVNTYVKLTSAQGDLIEYTVLDGVVDPRRNEITSADAAKLGILGRPVGTFISRNVGWEERDFEVVEILPTLVRDVQQAAFNYEMNFPGEPFFVTSYKIGNLDTVRDFAPFISSLESRKQFAEHALNLYRREGFPLGMIAKLLGVSIDDVITAVTSEQVTLADYAVEFPDRGEFGAAVATAKSASVCVLTRSALQSMDRFALLSEVNDHFKIIAPHSLIDELEEDLESANRMVADGHKVMSREGDRLTLIELEAGHPSLVANKETIVRKLEFVRANADVRFRPIELIQPGDSEPGTLRDIVGSNSYDAVILSLHGNIPMYADDLGLRRLAIGDSRPTSFSTISLLHALAEAGRLSGERRDGLLAELAIAGFKQVPPSRDLLLRAVRTYGPGNDSKLRRVFATLGSSGIDPGDAARIAVLVIRAQLLTNIQILSPERLVELALDAMSQRWQVSLCAQLISAATSIEFALFPQVSSDIQRACAQFVTQRATVRDVRTS